MECRMKSRVKAMVEALAREHQQELAAAGTLVELEELTCRIGDEFGRQLCESELVSRARQAADAEQSECPECGLPCPRGQPEPVVLQGLRGEVGYNQPSYFCRRCRRSFFPLAARLGLPARSTVTPKILRKMVWAGSNLGDERVAEREAAVEQFQELDLPKQQVGSTAVEPPQVGVITMDGGRYQRRDYFGDKERPAQQNHWREDKVGCLLSMRNHSAGSWPPERGKRDFRRPNDWHLSPTAPMRIGLSNANISAMPRPSSI